MGGSVENQLRVSGQEALLCAGDLALRLDLSAGARVTGATCAARPELQLLARWWCGYEADGQQWSDSPVQAPERSFGLGQALVRRDLPGGACEVVASAVAPHLRVHKRFTLYPRLPFVRVRYRVETTGVQGRGPGFSVGLPWVTLTDALADAFDLPADTADDGLDLGAGLALPAWRAYGDPSTVPVPPGPSDQWRDREPWTGGGTGNLPVPPGPSDQWRDREPWTGGGTGNPGQGQAGGAFGLLVFAADRQAMSRLQVTGRGFAFRPPYYLSYSTNVVTTREVRFGLEHQNYGPLDELDWYIGAFRRESLPQLRQLIAAFHARRRPTGGSLQVLEIEPGRSPWDSWDQSPTGGAAAALPPPDALPAPWPAVVTLAPGGRTTRHFLLPGEPDTAATPPPPPAGPVETHAGGVTASAQPEPGRPHQLRVAIAVAPDAAAGPQTLSLPLPGGALEVIVDVAPPRPLPAADEPPGQLVIGAAALAAPARAAGWLVVDAPALPGGIALLQRPGGGGQPIQVDPGLRGSFQIFAGIGEGAGIKFRLAGDPYWSYAHADRSDPAERVDIQTWQPLATLCRLDSSSEPHGEVRLRHASLEGPLQLAPHPYLNGFTVLSHLRFVPAPPAPAPLLTGRRRSLVGLADIPDVGNDIGEDSYQQEAWREVVAQHARAGIDTVYWRVDGQCADFHTKIGTVRYSVPRTHGLYSPRARSYGRALERLDPLRIATDEARRCGLRLLGWMRANNYSGNVVSQFFVQHPQWHEVREDGSPAPQLCFAIPEVRAHKTAILREAAAYGLDGLLIDTLRHPPMVGYHPVVVEAFRREYGEDPPQEPHTRLPSNRVDNRTGERWERWFRFRARFFAQLIRDVCDGLATDGLGHLPVHVRVAPTRFLHDGADLEALLDQRLVEAVVINRYVADPLDYDRLLAVVGGRVPVIGICDPIRGDPVELLRRLHADPRLGGAGIYESNRMVHTPLYRDALLDLALHPTPA